MSDLDQQGYFDGECWVWLSAGTAVPLEAPKGVTVTISSTDTGEEVIEKIRIQL